MLGSALLRVFFQSYENMCATLYCLDSVRTCDSITCPVSNGGVYCLVLQSDDLMMIPSQTCTCITPDSVLPQTRMQFDLLFYYLPYLVALYSIPIKVITSLRALHALIDVQQWHVIAQTLQC